MSFLLNYRYCYYTVVILFIISLAYNALLSLDVLKEDIEQRKLSGGHDYRGELLPEQGSPVREAAPGLLG